MLTIISNSIHAATNISPINENSRDAKHYRPSTIAPRKNSIVNKAASLIKKLR